MSESRKLTSNILFLKYFVINYILNFTYMYNAQWRISPKWKYCDFVHAINCTRKLTWVCTCVCNCMHLKEQYVDFWKVIYKNIEKKHSFHNKHIYIIQVTDTLSFYEVLFCTYCKGLFLSLTNSCSAYISLYMYKTLPTLRNEKEQ